MIDSAAQSPNRIDVLGLALLPRSAKWKTIQESAFSDEPYAKDVPGRDEPAPALEEPNERPHKN